MTRCTLMLLLAGSPLAAEQVSRPTPSPTPCPGGAIDRGTLDALQAQRFGVADDDRRHALALALLPCLFSDDPGIRDGIAYEALAAWMRGGLLRAETIRDIRTRLVPMLSPTTADPSGVGRPFAALVLAEVARADRLGPVLDDAQRHTLLTAATAYLSGVRDYRGLVDGQGWRHGVAHGADLLMQLALHPAHGRPALDAILHALATQVVAATPDGVHAYVHGESARLARATFVVATRRLHEADDWTRWLAGISEPGPLASWTDAFTSEAGLARRHDVIAFLHALYLLAQQSESADVRARLVPGIVAALDRVG